MTWVVWWQLVPRWQRLKQLPCSTATLAGSSCPLTFWPVMLTHICPPGQQLRDCPMLQSSPQQRGAKLVVAFLKQRLLGQQPKTPQHTCRQAPRAHSPLSHSNQSTCASAVQQKLILCFKPVAASVVPSSVVESTGAQQNQGATCQHCRYHGMACTEGPCIFLQHTNSARREKPSGWATAAAEGDQQLPAELLRTWPLGQHVGGSNGRVGITQGSHIDLGMSGRITLRRTTAHMKRTPGTA